MSYACKVVADSVSEAGKRITTFEVTYPRSVHSELLTHRMFSRNSASSRAIPVHKLDRQVAEDPYLPVYLGSAKAGMQAGAELPPEAIERARSVILRMRDACRAGVDELVEIGMHKQDANRYLEPWMYITVLITSTEWENFFKLRCHPHAHPALQKIAYMMRDAYATSTPTERRAGGWHCPFLKQGDFQLDGFDFESIRKLCVARCARVSYLTHSGEHDPLADRRLADQLASNGHWSPFEHVAMALDDAGERVGNFIGWRQYRADVDPGFLR